MVVLEKRGKKMQCTYVGRAQGFGTKPKTGWGGKWGKYYS